VLANRVDYSPPPPPPGLLIHWIPGLLGIVAINKYLTLWYTDK
jgi:hypothetical protein